MSELKWDTRFNIGVDIIDNAHQRLFSIVGKLLNLNTDESKRQHACQEGIKFFKSYALKHFSEEEAYMCSINYSGYAVHKGLHDNMLKNTLPALEKELEEQNYSTEAVQHFLGICVGWLNGHIMIEDRAITGRVPSKWIHQPSEDVLDSIVKAALPAIQILYRVKAELVSKRYNGENFSSEKVLCYRLTYNAKERPPIQVYLIYEERLILYALSEMIGKQIKVVDQTVQYAIQMLSEKFVDWIGCHFLSDMETSLKGTNLLTFDQLLRSFSTNYPPYSLLFSSGGKGYLAFCIQT